MAKIIGPGSTECPQWPRKRARIYEKEKNLIAMGTIWLRSDFTGDEESHTL